jgi:glycosyltransferase involved in cell wall biosynthesis
MHKIINDKITEFLNQNIEPDTPEIGVTGNVNFSELSGIILRMAELKCTIARLFYGDNTEDCEHKEKIDRLNNFLKKLDDRYEIFKNEDFLSKSARIFIDVSFTINEKSTTGIPRVVKEITKFGLTIDAIPVVLSDNKVYTVTQSNSFVPINFRKGDIFIHADAGWNYPKELSQALAEVSSNGGQSIVFLYDLIPLLYPQLSNYKHVLAFENWLNIVLAESNHIICISKSVADELISLLDCIQKTSHKIHSIGWSHLGCDFAVKPANASEVTRSFSTIISHPYFLSVGTIEPRKAYSIAIDAMDKLWEKGIEASYVIVGKYGWSQAQLKERIMSHCEYGKRLFWFDSASDKELEYLYKDALALVSSSLCEGFGLPVIEAAHYNLSSIVSDIPVFREIGGRSTQYFEVTNSQELADLLSQSLLNPKAVPDLDFLTWKEAVNNILAMIKASNYQHKIN